MKMKWKYLRKSKAGWVSELPGKDKLPYRCRTLLNDLVKEFAKENERFYSMTGERAKDRDILLDYDERQVNSVLLPAFRSVKGVSMVVMQHPVKRTVKRKDKRGWIDYWVDYHDSVIVLEFKYTKCVSLDSSERIQNGWKDAICQLESIGKDEEKFLKWKRRKLFKICLSIVSIKQQQSKLARSKNRDLAKPRGTAYIESKLDQIDRLMGGLKELTWAACWVLHRKLQEPFKDEESNYWNYPAVLFFARSI